MPKREPLPDVSSVDAAPMGQVGDYKLLEPLGKGGMGQVYKARHAQMKRIEAVKILAPEHIGDEAAVARFKREIEIVASLDHPHIVRAHNALQVEGNYLLIMEYLAGLTLAEVVRSLGRLPVADACELIRQAALGLQCAFEHKLVHRDIKPSNLMLTPAGQVKILDLGLARSCGSESADRAVTATGLMVGTPDYISPEQVKESKTVDIRADIYSLGCSLFELLCGRPPFGGDEHATVYGKLEAHVKVAPPDIRSLRAEIPDGLAGIVSRMLAKEPERRFATPQEVATQLEPFAAGANPARLLARASRGRGVDSVRAESDGKVAAAQAADTGRAASLTARGESAQATSAASGWWKGAVAGAVLCLAAVIGVWALVGRPWAPDGDGTNPAIPDVDQPHVSAPADQPPTRQTGTGSAEPSSWIVLSWAPPAEPFGLWLVSRDGEQRIRLTRPDESVDTEPAFSPDGRRIAFVRARRAAGTRSDLWLHDLASGETRQVGAAGGESARLMSPVWVSNDRILYTRNPSLESVGDMEVWQADVGDGSAAPGVPHTPKLMFRFGGESSPQAGFASDVGPNGNRLLVIAGRPGDVSSSDLVITDLQGGLIAPVWQDGQNEKRDSRGLWSPSGERIAWQHQADVLPIRVGVGLAVAGDDGKWDARLQPQGRVPVIMPVAWSPDSEDLLCMRLYGTPPDSLRAAFFLIGMDFAVTDRLFELPGGRSIAAQRHSGRLGDWALIPPDVSLPLPGRSN